MDLYTAAELAYKNGYRKGVQDTMTNEMPRYVAYITHDVSENAVEIYDCDQNVLEWRIK